ncbi:hypothetical protein GE061_017695, partial [Apolygus lucorum]
FTPPNKHLKDVEDSSSRNGDSKTPRDTKKSSKLRVRIQEPTEVLTESRNLQRSSSASRRENLSQSTTQNQSPNPTKHISKRLVKDLSLKFQHTPKTPVYSTQSTPDLEHRSHHSPEYEYVFVRRTSNETSHKRRGKFHSFSSFDSGTSERIKLPMNKVQVGAAPSPNLKVVKSKIGSLENAKHKPGGGQIKIESRKLDFKAGPRIEAKNDTYSPGGGEKKIQQVKLQWNAKSKIGSLENATHKPGGGDKKIESLKLDFKDKAKPKVGSKDNLKHVPGGGQVKIEDQKLDIKAQSRVGSLDNVKYKPGGGEVKIFDDKEYMKNVMGSTSDVHSASNQARRTSRSSSSSRTRLSGSKSGTRENLTDDLYSPEKPQSKPLTKPTDQNSNQLNRAHNDSKDEPKAELDTKDVTHALDDKKPPLKDGGAALPNNLGEPPSGPHREDLHAAVIEKSQIEMPEKELTKP